jgi:hypothetical protein
MIFTAATLAGVAILAAEPAMAMPAAPLGQSVESPVTTVRWGGHWGGGGGHWGGGRWGGWGGHRVWAGRPAYGYGYARPWRRGWYGGGYAYPAYGYGYGYPAYGYPYYDYGYGYPAYGYGYGYDPGAAVAAGIVGLATGAILTNAYRHRRAYYPYHRHYRHYGYRPVHHYHAVRAHRHHYARR